MINKLKRLRKEEEWCIPELSEKSQVPAEIIKQLGVPETEIFVPEEKPEMPRFYLDII